VEVFQSINFIRGSEQALHSDSLHMMTFPKGNLIAVWIALEDIYMDAGAIEYFPKSHHLPYLTNEDIGAKNNCLFLDSMSNKKNEAKVAELIKTHHLPGEIFLAKKGDALVWHANLLHGGLPILNPQLTRKSMVAHYFAKDVICYHEISERPALFI
jgi:ectoine hydroxylase-related dioxygenase (phytanoyl-CoA dioxygenase family)